MEVQIIILITGCFFPSVMLVKSASENKNVLNYSYTSPSSFGNDLVERSSGTLNLKATVTQSLSENAIEEHQNINSTRSVYFLLSDETLKNSSTTPTEFQVLEDSNEDIMRKQPEDGTWRKANSNILGCEYLTQLPATVDEDVVFSELIKNCISQANQNNVNERVTSEIIINSTNFIEEMANHLNKAQNPLGMIENLLASIDVLLKDDLQYAWDSILKKEENKNFSSTSGAKLMNSVEKATKKLLEIRPHGEMKAFEKDNVVLQIFKLNKSNLQSSLDFPSYEIHKMNPWIKTSVTVSTEFFASYSNMADLAIVYTAYKTLHRYSHFEDLSIVSSNLITVSLYNGTVPYTEMNEITSIISLNFVENSFLAPALKNYTKNCGWLHRGSGFWSTEGCSISDERAESVLCQCNHMTDFAVVYIQKAEMLPIYLCIASQLTAIVLMLIIWILVFRAICRKTTYFIGISLIHETFDCILMSLIYLLTLPEYHINIPEENCIWIQRLLHFAWFQLFVTLIVKELYKFFQFYNFNLIKWKIIIIFFLVWAIPLIVVIIISVTSHLTYEGCQPWSLTSLHDMSSSIKFGFILPLAILTMVKTDFKIALFLLVRQFTFSKHVSPLMRILCLSKYKYFLVKNYQLITDIHSTTSRLNVSRVIDIILFLINVGNFYRKNSNWKSYKSSKKFSILNTCIILPIMWTTWLTSVHSFYEDRQLGLRLWLYFFAAVYFLQIWKNVLSESESETIPRNSGHFNNENLFPSQLPVHQYTTSLEDLKDEDDIEPSFYQQYRFHKQMKKHSNSLVDSSSSSSIRFPSLRSKMGPGASYGNRDGRNEWTFQ